MTTGPQEMQRNSDHDVSGANPKLWNHLGNIHQNFTSIAIALPIWLQYMKVGWCSWTKCIKLMSKRS